MFGAIVLFILIFIRRKAAKRQKKKHDDANDLKLDNGEIKTVKNYSLAHNGDSHNDLRNNPEIVHGNKSKEKYMEHHPNSDPEIGNENK
jgi:hypothetical protein